VSGAISTYTDALAKSCVCAGGAPLREQPHALCFLHGFNVTFADAAIRAAQIGYDLKVPGATAFFSWPSRGSVAAYPVDEASIEASERAITDFLVDFTAHCGAEKVHVIAHSMGNRGLLRALQRIAAQAQTLGRLQLARSSSPRRMWTAIYFSTSPTSTRSTPSAPRSMPPMATGRCISPRSCTTRRAPDTRHYRK
jgi:pimeloyl-ACP methyl ester carboxylesterase